MSGDKLQSLKDMPVPPPSEAARASALAAAMAAFDAAGKENAGEPQENPAPARLTHASTQTQRRRSMRANYFHYKIAASIAVLVLAAPMALYMYKQDMRGGVSVPPEPRPVLSRDIASAGGGESFLNGTVTSNRITLGGAAKSGKDFPAHEKTVYERLQPGDARAAASPAGNPAPDNKVISQRFTPEEIKAAASSPPGRTLDDRIDEALKGASGTSSAPDGDNRPTVVRGETYGPDGKPVNSRPVVTPSNSTPSAEAIWGSPIGPLRADFGVADQKQVNGQSQTFRFGAATRFGYETSASSTAGTGQQPPDSYDAEPRAETRAQFEALASNAVKQVAAEPVSTFSIDVDTASYGFVRRSLLAGGLPPRDAVRVEEMVNYFPYDYPRPESAAVPFEPTVTVTPSPWKPTNKLVHIGIKGYEIAAKERPRANLVFLIDVSGSMAPDDRLPLLKNAFRMLVDELKPGDSVGIVTYASDSSIALEPVTLGEVQDGRIVASKAKILEAIDRLHAGGSTAGGAGLKDAYRLAGTHFDKNAVNRIVLATDGDFNVGISNHEELKRFIEAKRQTGIYLSVIGVGHDNYNDRLMQTLAQNGNGVAAYVDTLNEARKVLVDEASSSLFPIAKDVKIQVEFNPAQVSEYRLIGYETRALKREDFNNDHVDAGEIGSGHTVTAIYEIAPVGAPKFVDDLRYKKPEAQPAPAPGAGGELGFLKIRYKLPGEETSKLITAPIAAGPAQPEIQAAPEDVRFSIAVAAFGQMLRGDPFTAGFGYDGIVALAQTARGADPFGYRAEFLNLVRLAKSARR